MLSNIKLKAEGVKAKNNVSFQGVVSAQLHNSRHAVLSTSAFATPNTCSTSGREHTGCCYAFHNNIIKSVCNGYILAAPGSRQSKQLVVVCSSAGRSGEQFRSGPGRGGAGGSSQGSNPRRSSQQQQQQKGSASSDVPQRLAKVLAAAGVASRRACEDLIAAGEVKVNGEVVQEQGVKVTPGKDRIEVKGQKVSVASAADAAQRLVYFAVNKPKGFVCSNIDAKGSGKRCVDILQPWLDTWARNNKDKSTLPPRLFTVGRLDVNTSGLVLVTNDGQWANRVIHPSSGLTKEYIVALEGTPTQAQMATLAKGAEVEGAWVTPVEVELVSSGDRSGAPARVRVVVAEGRKHEVRELVAAAGMTLKSLKRVRVGGLRLPRDLGMGGFKELGAGEVKAVTDLRAQDRASSGMLRMMEQQAAAQRGAAGALSRTPPPKGIDPATWAAVTQQMSGKPKSK